MLEKNEAERPVTPRRRRPDGHRCVWPRQGQTRQRQARQGQRQREPRTARTTRASTRTKNKDSIECWNCGERVTTPRILGTKKTRSTKVVQRERTKKRTQRTLTILTRHVSYLDADAVEVRESEWIKIGVDTGAGTTVTRLLVPQRFNCCEEDRCMDPEGDERFTILQSHSCVQREQRVQHLHETERKQY